MTPGHPDHPQDHGDGNPGGDRNGGPPHDHDHHDHHDDHDGPAGHHELSVQERLYPTLTCFGCGHANPKGLKLRSYEAPGHGARSPATAVTGLFMPWPEHDNGVGFLNGGIIATLLDCHSAAAVVLEAKRQGWEALGGALLPFVTAGIDVRYLRPSPLTEPVELWAAVTRSTESEMTVDVELRFEEKTRATATATWRRWRPRPAGGSGTAPPLGGHTPGA